MSRHALHYKSLEAVITQGILFYNLFTDDIQMKLQQRGDLVEIEVHFTRPDLDPDNFFQEFCVVVYSLEGHPTAHSKADLVNKDIGILTGTRLYVYGLEEVNATFYRVTDSLQSLRMLQKGRIDFSIQYYPNTQQMPKQLVFDPKFVLQSFFETLQCHNQPENIDVISAFNHALEQLINNGQYQLLVDKYYPDMVSM